MPVTYLTLKSYMSSWKNNCTFMSANHTVFVSYLWTQNDSLEKKMCVVETRKSNSEL